MEKASQSDTEKSTLNSIKCEGFAHCLLRWQRRDGSWVFARRSIRNNALKMRVVYVKRYEEKARVCRKIIYGFCITIIQLFTHRLSVIFWPKTTTVYHAYNRRTHRTWPPATFSRFQMKWQMFATIEETKTVSLEELKTTPKNAYQKWFRLEKTLAQVYYIWRDYFEGDEIYIYEQIIVFWEK